MKKRIVIKLSGRIFSIEESQKLLNYAKLISKISRTFQPIIIAGGGEIARHYISRARTFGADETSLDELGIDVSRINAKLMIHALKDMAYPYPPTSLEEVKHAANTGQVVVTGGLQPGQSTNATAALIAEKVNGIKFVNATDVDGIYSSDPRQNKDAKKFEKITVEQLSELLSYEESIAGGYDLMDIVALKIIKRSKLQTVILNVKISSLENAILKNKKEGTLIVV